MIRFSLVGMMALKRRDRVDSAAQIESTTGLTEKWDSLKRS